MVETILLRTSRLPDLVAIRIDDFPLWRDRTTATKPPAQK
jgi:hypothetical protein